MFIRKSLSKFIILFAILTIFILLISYLYIEEKQNTLLNKSYEKSSISIKKRIHSLIEDKKNATLNIALALSQNKQISYYLKNKKYKNFDFDKLSKNLKKHTSFKNVWIRVLDAKMSVVCKSWQDKNIKVLKNKNNNLIKTPTTFISIENFDINFKARVPIFLENEFLGCLEVITHFNSILKKLKDDEIQSLILLDKNKFSKEFSILNKNSNQKILHFSKKHLDEFFYLNDFLILKEFFITKYTINLKNKKNKAFIFIFINKNKIDTSAIKNFKIQTLLFIVGIIFLLGLVLTFFAYFINHKSTQNINERLKKHIRKLRLQEKKKQLILDSQSSIIVITNGEKLLNANKQLFNFFSDTKDIKEFIEKYTCICTKFEAMNDKTYLLDIDYEGKNWAEYILANPNIKHKVAIYDANNKLKHFSVSVSQGISEDFIVVTFTDITEDIIQKEQLHYLNKDLEEIVQMKTEELKKLNNSLELRVKQEIKKSQEKDRLLFHQSKMTAIENTLKNIAHHWRQPLSAISTIASGMQIQKEMNLLDDDTFNDSCKKIIKNTKNLSKTIDNFSNFFLEEKHKKKFSLVEAVKDTLALISSSLNNNNIKMVFNYDKDFYIYGYENEFKQAVLSIIDNSIYSINEKDELDKIIFIEFKNSVLQIKDSGTGIKPNALAYLFEPYFTTKHQSYGIGMGLYMVRELLTKQMNFKIDLQNVTFNHDYKEYKGAIFIINFN